MLIKYPLFNYNLLDYNKNAINYRKINILTALNKYCKLDTISFSSMQTNILR